MIKFAKEKEASAAIMEAMKSGDEAKIQEAWENFHNSVAEQVMEDVEAVKASNDAAVLAQRGYRQLTSKETAFYQKVIDALKSKAPQQAFATIIGSDEEEELMPETIIEDVYKDLTEEYPLIGAVNFQYVKYLTKWILNDHTKQKAVWGALNTAITQAITSSFKTMDVKQCKLTAYAFIEKDMLELGPTFLDGYIRTCLKEALAYGLEDGIVNGTGKDQPAGLIRNLSGAFNPSTGYAAKTAVEVTDFTPKTYGNLLATLAETEEGRPRKFNRVALAVNNQDYLTKIMPATTVLNGAGAYVNNLFPFPTDVYVSNSVADNHAIMFLPDEYYLIVGGDRGGVIEYSDDFKFLDDQRYFKIKQYANGRAFDNTCAIYLDISKLDPAYMTVKVGNTVETTVKGTVTTTQSA